jgi:hypothetical protein
VLSTVVLPAQPHHDKGLRVVRMMSFDPLGCSAYRTWPLLEFPFAKSVADPDMRRSLLSVAFPPLPTRFSMRFTEAVRVETNAIPSLLCTPTLPIVFSNPLNVLPSM